MRKLWIFAFGALLFVRSVQAQTIGYLEEVQYLGAISGQGLACNSEKYHTFELLARAILISKARSDEQQAQGMRVFNNYKATAFADIVESNMVDCEDINRTFNTQKIFKATLYGDGTIKMPDGKIVTPRQPYDATLVYKKDESVRQRFLNLYLDHKKKVQSNPEYQRILREQSSKSVY